MSARGVENELLFGLIALQNHLISREALVAAVSAWLQDKSRPLSELLIERKALPAEHGAAVRILAEAHLARHDHDARQSLATLGGLGLMRDELYTLGDSDLQASLAALAAAPWKTSDPALLDETLTTLPGQRPSGAIAHARYEIVRPHALGGLGEVLVARDLELHREVAFKRIREPFADDAGSRRRFLLEAEITGALEHPGIVPIYGVGHHADGRPFYAMRFIRGESLQEAAETFHRRFGGHEAPKLPTETYSSLAFRQLLRRFLDVCNAIEYAHSRGVLHRDLKPGNVMLGMYGETLVVDWGLAKVTERPEDASGAGIRELRPPSSEGGSPTLAGAAIGTPAYMPPEQASGRLGELGPASDVYALGATLYHIVAGRAPFEKEDAGAVLRKVERGEFTPLAKVQPHAPAALAAICRQAMALRAGDRYPSPKALADDVERYLADEPVFAQTQTAGIRARRWMRKHSRSVAALAAIFAIGLLSLMAIAVVVAGKNFELAKSNLELVKATAAERRSKNAAEAQRQDAEKARRQEALERELAEAVTRYMVRAFRKADPAIDGREVKVADLLDETVARMPEELGGQPIVRAKLLIAIAQTYRGLGLLKECLAACQEAYDLFQANLGDRHPDTQRALNDLAAAHWAVGDAAMALPLFEKCLTLSEASLGSDHPDTLTTLNNLAAAHHRTGSRKAVELHERCLAGRSKVLGEDHPDTLASLNNVAIARARYGEEAAARPAFELFHSKLAKLHGEDHPNTLTALCNLAESHRTNGDLSTALTLAERCLERRRAVLGDDHPDTLFSLRSVLAVYLSLKNVERAMPLAEECLEKRRAILGDDHPDTLVSQGDLAHAFELSGDYDEAIRLHEQTLEAKRRKLGEDHPSTLRTLNNLAETHRRSGNLAKAVTLFEECLALSREKLGDDHPSTATTLENLARAYLASERGEQALPLFRELVEAQRQRSAGDALMIALFQWSTARELLEHRQYAEAEKYLRESLGTIERLRPDHWSTFAAKCQLGAAIAGQGRFEEAEPLCLDGYNGLVHRHAGVPVEVKLRIEEALQRLIDLYTAWEKPAVAAKWQALVEPETPAPE
jgi:serine/threonine protein kinase